MTATARFVLKVPRSPAARVAALLRMAKTELELQRYRTAIALLATAAEIARRCADKRLLEVARAGCDAVEAILEEESDVQSSVL